MPKLVAMLGVKDGRLFIGRWLTCMENFIDELVVVDNGNTSSFSEGTAAARLE
jgi:hypothetical protein